MMNIVMVPFHDYKKWLNEGFRTRDAHLCQHFEKDASVEKILVVNRPTSLAEVLLKRAPWKTGEGSEIYCKHGIRLSKMSEKVYCIDFFLTDFWKVAKQKKMWWFTAFKYRKVLDGVNDAIKSLGMSDCILMLQNPMAIGVVEGVACRSFVFDAIDNWLYHPQMKDKQLIGENYNYVDTKADLILTVSESLTHTFRTNKNVQWVPNGVDVEYFADAIKPADEQKKTVIGYVGKIQERVDFDLVEACLKALPDCEFEFLGPAYAQGDRIKALAEQYRNIHFAGDVHYTQLPAAMRSFDITIIPHKVDAFTDSMNPLKLYEYLAAGKLVVTTGVAGIGDISPYVYTAADQDSFIAQLKKAIDAVHSPDCHTDDIVASIPAECCWTNRVNTILELFAKL